MLLQMKGISKIYGELIANDNIDLTLEKGEVLAVIGENGAGKSTLMKILYGLEPPTHGEIYINGERVKINNPTDAIKYGIGMVQQHFMLFEPFTIAENIVYGREPEKGIFFDGNKAVAEVRKLSEKYLLDVDPTMKIKDCSVGLQQRVEILKILYQDADIIIFDEPSAVLTPQEVRELLKTMKQLVKMGKSIILITHKLHEVMEVADRAMVLRNGRYVKEMPISETSIEELSYLMVGRKIIDKTIKKQEAKERLLSIDNLVLKGTDEKNILNGVNMYVDAGEIVGIAGVSGNGQSELIKCITGLMHADSGEIILLDEEIKNKSVGEIREIGCAHIPEDRYLFGCAKEASLIETGIMTHYKKDEFSQKGMLKSKEIKEFIKGLISGYAVKASGYYQKAGELSGGNIQKLIVAREISQETPFLIASEPTRGVDIGAMEFIHDKLIEKRGKGDGILLVSSELSEIMTLSDRVYVMYEGRINGEFSREEVSEDKLGILMVGGERNGQ